MVGEQSPPLVALTLECPKGNRARTEAWSLAAGVRDLRHGVGATFSDRAVSANSAGERKSTALQRAARSGFNAHEEATPELSSS